MGLAETLLMSLGPAAAGAILRLWIQDDAARHVLEEGFSKLLSKAVKDAFARRRAETQFEQIAVEIAERIAPFVEKEAGSITENEQASATAAVAESIKNSAISRRFFLDQDLDPLAIEHHFAELGREKLVGLSDKGKDLYRKVLRETCNYIVEIVMTLPSFRDSATIELLGRTSEIQNIVRQILDEMPKTTASDGARSLDEEFEDQYRREVARQLNSLELFGVDVSRRSKRYALSVGYITLSASQTKLTPAPAFSEEVNLWKKRRDRTSKIPNLREGGESKAREERSPDGDANSDAEAGAGVFLRVDEAIGGHTRHVVKGEAGSGKTTLLQWMAVQAAQRAFEGPLEYFNNVLPFFLQLRRFPDGAMLAPEQFLDQTARNLVGEMPTGWVHRQLKNGRGLLLIDGVDEVPEEHRSKARKWIGDLSAQFASTWIIVTSRPPAIDDDWLEEAGFYETELQPMSLEDIGSFIDHWHQAAAGTLVRKEDLEELESTRENLKSIVRENKPLRNLATSPLLCAMLCALHRERKTQLPRDRIELYRIALETLTDRRDVEREVLALDGPEPTGREKLILLQDLAYWYMLNGKSDAAKDEVIPRLSNKLGLMPNLRLAPSKPPAESIFQYLLLRSGVIREPIKGRVDFIHRTFQEYLAAKEAVEANNIGFLISRGPSDQWREVIVLAAGLANREQREELLKGLIDAGNKRGDLRHTLHLVAAACLETSPELSAELTEEIRQILRGLIPPKNISEAKALASAGELALPQLRGHTGRKAVIAAATVRALSLIGGEKALDMIAAHRTDSRVTVQREVIRAWDSFDPEEYAKQVLGDAPLEDGRLTVDDSRHLAHAHHIKNLFVLNCQMGGSLKSSEPFSRMHSLHALILRGCSSLLEIEGVRKLEKLGYLNITRCQGLQDLSPLQDVPSLRFLVAISCSGVEDFTPLGSVELEALDLDSCQQLVNVQFLRQMKDLTELDVSNCNNIDDPSPISSLEHLNSFAAVGCDWVNDVSFVVGLAGLKYLNLAYCEYLESLEGIGQCAGLLRLDLSGCGALQNIGPLDDFSSLKDAAFGNAMVTDLAPLQAHRSLRTLDLSGCERVADLSPLRTLENLRELNLERCTALTSLEALRKVPRLRTLRIVDCPNIESIACLIGHKSLRRIALSRSAGISDSEIEELRNDDVLVSRFGV